MTVIATIITKHCTAHASDSFLTEKGPTGEFEVIESEATKLVKVPKFSGIISFWGFASAKDPISSKPLWNTLDWLRQQAASASSYEFPEPFARHLASSLTKALARFTFKHEQEGGLGLHFTAYERVGDYWVPELFQIRNWVDEQYKSVRPDGFEVRRETYGTVKRIPERSAEDGSTERRLCVQKELHSKAVLLRFVNGDPVLFNPVADATFSVFEELGRRGALDDPESVATHLAMVRRPVEMISNLLIEFCPEGKRRVGGKPHDLAVRHGPRYQSNTGDG
jgi:hypothetical protein